MQIKSSPFEQTDAIAEDTSTHPCVLSSFSTTISYPNSLFPKGRPAFTQEPDHPFVFSPAADPNGCSGAIKKEFVASPAIVDENDSNKNLKVRLDFDAKNNDRVRVVRVVRVVGAELKTKHIVQPHETCSVNDHTEAGQGSNAASVDAMLSLKNGTLDATSSFNDLENKCKCFVYDVLWYCI